MQGSYQGKEVQKVARDDAEQGAGQSCLVHRTLGLELEGGLEIRM